MLKKVLIANRGAIACRIMRTLKKMGIASVAVYADSDRDSLHVRMADEAFPLGVGAAAATYLDQSKILAIAKQTGAQAIHPGYGFLSENPRFAEACEAAGIRFIGPTPEQMRLFGLKHTAREIAAQHRVPLAPGSGLLADVAAAEQFADSVGYPVIIKSTAGGGGIGMQICRSHDEVQKAFESVRRLSEGNFADSGVFIEKYIEKARHIEVQVFGDGDGNVVTLGERDCSMQRRNQKVIEEAPAPGLSGQLRDSLHAAAKQLMTAVNYRNAGTVEFIFDTVEQKFYFLEVNTRLQVEHGVTEKVFNVDLVEWMLLLAGGELPSLEALRAGLSPQGHAVQARIYAEDPNKQFQPCAGLLTQVEWPAPQPGWRIDHWIEAGIEVPAFFDPMLAKVIVHADDRPQAIAQLDAALGQTQIYGIETNISYVRSVLRTAIFQQGDVFTRYLSNHIYAPNTIDVLSAGTQTTLQDYPGRLGYWDVGIPPSGPFDSYSFRLGNQLLGNAADAAGLEITVSGPRLRFNCACAIVVTGAPIAVGLDGQPQKMWEVITVPAGGLLTLGKIQTSGARSYLLMAGGFRCPDYLGAKATFTLGQFGGHGGRALLPGDVLHLAAPAETAPGKKLAPAALPSIQHDWVLRVMYGPHGAPDFFTEKDIETFFAANWEVHYNSSRTGVRLIGPKPDWARTDGGEAGLHPSNIHDNAYAIGAVDFTGDMPVILGPDGPSLGGFVCPVTVIEADLWKLGQLRAGDKVTFVPVSYAQARTLAEKLQAAIMQLAPIDDKTEKQPRESSPIISAQAANTDQAVVYRQAGDCNILVEYGPLQLDIKLRFRAHALMLALQAKAYPGIIDLTPGIRSLQIHFDPAQLPREQLISILQTTEQALGAHEVTEVPSRIVHLPLSWDDEACRLAIEKYTQSVRKDAPWCPSNIEFIRRINGLPDIQAVKDIVFNAHYLVMGLGDVYLGAPVATPIDPRHRLVTTKYNPARTWTAENSVGIGGAYLCIYGMEGPGGYQFVGRTVQMWNRYAVTHEFTRPWLLRFFDQIRFYPVAADELLDIRKGFLQGRYPIKIEETTFSIAEYNAFLSQHAESIQSFTAQRERAFAAELADWKATGKINFSVDQSMEAEAPSDPLPDGCEAIESPVSGSVWKLLVVPGDVVALDQPIAILESMKMEIELSAPSAGVIESLSREEGQSVRAGQTIMVLRRAGN